MAEQITVESAVAAPIEKVWECFNNPEHVMQWNHASDDWHSPRAENDLRAGGKFNYRMEAKDGSAGFDFTGVYDEVVPNEKIAYTMGDGRKAMILFVPEGSKIRVKTTFDPENENSLEVQRAGWQAILDSFRSHVESH